ncbi:unnamed protein product [Pieris macdunnoughi]|uniref:Uncharacterized protein n=1 Tax=Pieris macdunnoughi TaxID=345717 RepID=A0A821KSR1_9NEOP|nr:unnamed protein product [Pieris macdunnoughi]
MCMGEIYHTTLGHFYGSTAIFKNNSLAVGLRHDYWSESSPTPFASTSPRVIMLAPVSFCISWTRTTTSPAQPELTDVRPRREADKHRQTVVKDLSSL